MVENKEWDLTELLGQIATDINTQKKKINCGLEQMLALEGLGQTPKCLLENGRASSKGE